MSNPWDAEKTIDAQQALQIIQNQFPELYANTIVPFGAGWDNTAYLINEKYVFRFPRREIAVPLLLNEGKVLPKLAPALPIPIPNPAWLGKTTIEYQWPFLGYKKLQGVTACSLDLSDKQREYFVKPLALFLKTLHSIPTKPFEDILPGDTINRLSVATRTPRIRTLLQKLAQLRLIPHVKLLHDIIDNAQSLAPSETRVICHGDLYARHLLIDAEYQLTGIIDWGDLHLNCPAVDLSLVHSFLPPHTHDQFKKLYGPISQDTWDLARFRAINHCLNLINFGHTSDEPDLKREGILGLEYIALAIKK